MTSTYAFESAEAGSELFRGERAGYIYGRTRNPTQALLASRLASLEGGEAGIAVASGMGAISASDVDAAQQWLQRRSHRPASSAATPSPFSMAARG